MLKRKKKDIFVSINNFVLFFNRWVIFANVGVILTPLTKYPSFLSSYNFKLGVKRNFDMVDTVQLYIEIPWFIR